MGFRFPGFKTCCRAIPRLGERRTPDVYTQEPTHFHPTSATSAFAWRGKMRFGSLGSAARLITFFEPTVRAGHRPAGRPFRPGGVGRAGPIIPGGYWLGGRAGTGQSSPPFFLFFFFFFPDYPRTKARWEVMGGACSRNKKLHRGRGGITIRSWWGGPNELGLIAL